MRNPVVLAPFVALLVALAASPALCRADGGVLVGRVVEGSAPVEQAMLVARTPGGEKLGTASSDARGAFRILLPAGTYLIECTRTGYKDLLLPDVEVRDGDTTSLVIALEVKPYELEPISISAQRRPEKLTEAPAAISVIDARKIQSRPVATAIDHIQELPGVDLVISGVQGRQLATRGFNEVFGTGVLMLSDYRYGALPSLRANIPYFLTSIPDDIERIEVALGPASAAYGPNSADGVVHVITKSPFTSPGTATSITLGERDFRHVTVRHAAVASPRVAYKLSGQVIEANDWERKDPAERAARDAHVERYAGDARVDMRVGDRATLALSAGTTFSKSALELTGIGTTQVRDWRYDFAQARISTNEMFAQVFVNASSAGKTFHLRTLDPVVDDSRVLGAQAQNGMTVAQRLALRYGIDFAWTDPRSGGTISGRNEDDDRSTELGGFLHADLPLVERVRLVGAARLDRHSRMRDVEWSPRVAMVYGPAPGHHVRLTYNRAFQNPTSTDLFLDVLAARLDPLPFNLRALGVPEDGFRFPRDPSGLPYMTSPFAPGGGFMPLDATALWPAVVAIMQAGGVDLSGIPAPQGSSVGTDLKVLDLNTGGFRAVSPSEVRDVDALRPTVSQEFELGYKGLLGQHVLFTASAYQLRRSNFQGPLLVETPNAFLNSLDLEQYLASYMAQDQAHQLAIAIAGIPLGTVSPDHSLAGQDIVMTYRNFGEVRLWGGELGLQAIGARWTGSASVSYVSDNFIPRSEIGGLSDIALNGPRWKGSASIAYADTTRRWSSELRARAVQGFPMTSGVWVGRVPGYALLDARLGVPVPRARNMMVSLVANNLLDRRHFEFVGAPLIGRLLLVRLHYGF